MAKHTIRLTDLAEFAGTPVQGLTLQRVRHPDEELTRVMTTEELDAALARDASCAFDQLSDATVVDVLATDVRFATHARVS